MQNTFTAIFRSCISVITATNRLAHEQKQRLDLEYIKQGEKAWISKQTLPFHSWVSHQWNDNYSNYTLLDNLHLLKIAENVLNGLSNSSELSIASTALWDSKQASSLLLDAWTLSLNWEITLSKGSNFASRDHSLFITWAAKFKRELEVNNWVSPSQLPSLINRELLGNSFERNLIFSGFDYLLPVQNRLIENLKSWGIQVEVTKLGSPYIDSSKHRVSFSKLEQEWAAIAAWAANKVKQSSNFRVALICPDTQSIKDVAIQALDDQLDIKNTISSKPKSDHEKPYHISLGTTLSKTLLGESALLHLSLLSRFEFQELSDWLLSPLSSFGIDIESRSAVTISLRQRVPYEMDLFNLIQALSSDDVIENELKLILEELLTLKKATTGRRTYRQWATFFRECLSLLKWPKVGLNSHEHQVLESWNGCVDQFAALDVVSTPVYLSEALSNIKRLCDQTIYQDQANPNVQIHIMGVLEAAELSFDAVWLAGFHENAWPPKPQVNPFIPLSVQREKGIPEAVPEIFLQNAKDKTKQLLAMAPEVIVSHASNIDDISVGTSPLFSHIELSELLVKPFDIYNAIREAHCKVETIQDDFGVPFTPDKASGGASLIASQAACPFQAYAKYRLLADEESFPEPGTDHRVHGTLVHEILHQFWQQVKTQRNLHDLIHSGQLEPTLDLLIPPAIEWRNKASGLKEQFDHAQTARIKALLLDWLEVEAARPPFSVSLHEQRIEYSLAGLSLNFIIDRVDELEGRIGNAVIDYKTGGSNTEKDWCGDRLSSPQLPLYALAVTEQMGEVEAIAYGQINKKKTELVGLVAEADLLLGLKPPESHSKNSSTYKDLQDWDHCLPLWKERLENIATEFREGEAIVNPKDQNKDCIHCEFTSFCRIKELSAQGFEEDDELA